MAHLELPEGLQRGEVVHRGQRGGHRFLEFWGALFLRNANPSSHRLLTLLNRQEQWRWSYIGPPGRGSEGEAKCSEREAAGGGGNGREGGENAHRAVKLQQRGEGAPTTIRWTCASNFRLRKKILEGSDRQHSEAGGC